MEFREFKAKTVNDAVTDALIALEITSDMIEYEVIEEGSTGLLGLFSRDAVIRARRKEDIKAEEDVFDIRAELRAGSLMKPEKAKSGNKQKKDETPVQKKADDKNGNKEVKAVKEVKETKEAKETKETDEIKETAASSAKTKAYEKPFKAESERMVPEETEPYKNDTAEQLLGVIFKKLGINANISSTIDRTNKIVNIIIDGDDTGDIIGKRGQTLDAIQYLVSLIINKDQESYYRVKLDTNNYRERRQKTLENLAKNMAAKAKKTRKKVVLEPMNPYERRVIHSYLQSDKYVTTKSEGVEPDRRVVIYYKKA